MKLFSLPKSPEDFPDALQGGEGLESPDHRISETTRQDPVIDDVEPSSGGAGKDDEPAARPPR